MSRLDLDRLRDDKTSCAFDGLHEYRRWRDPLKGLFDQHEEELSVLVTAGARLDVFERGGDSLMGRYFPYTLDPVSVAEIAAADREDMLDHSPRAIDADSWEALNRFGGFPEPFDRGEQRFWTRWRGLRTQQPYGDPWFLVEVKTSGRAPLSDALVHFQQRTGAAHPLQVAMDLPFVERDCLETTRPTIVPARTLLAQLVQDPQKSNPSTSTRRPSRNASATCVIGDRSMSTDPSPISCAMRS